MGSGWGPRPWGGGRGGPGSGPREPHPVWGLRAPGLMSPEGASEPKGKTAQPLQTSPRPRGTCHHGCQAVSSAKLSQTWGDDVSPSPSPFPSLPSHFLSFYLHFQVPNLPFDFLQKSSPHLYLVKRISENQSHREDHPASKGARFQGIKPGLCQPHLLGVSCVCLAVPPISSPW